MSTVGGALISAFITYPVTRNLPYPAEGGFGKNFRWIQEIRGLLHIVIGYRPMEYIYHRDPTPIPLLAGILILVSVVFLKWATRAFGQMNREKALEVAGIVFTTIVIFALSLAKRRYLSPLGSERYLLCVLPGWLLLWSDAVVDVFSNLRWYRYALGLLILIPSIRICAPMIGCMSKPDPFLVTSAWLAKACPKDRCVAYLENYWNYWPIRFYTRDKLELNGLQPIMNAGGNVPVRGRAVIACWFRNSPSEFPNSYSTKNLFPDGYINPGLTCFSGITPPI
jgi:hypothetical protein